MRWSKNDTEFTAATRIRNAKGLVSYEVYVCQLDLTGDLDKKGDPKKNWLTLFRSVHLENWTIYQKVATMCLGEKEEAILHNGPRMAAERQLITECNEWLYAHNGLYVGNINAKSLSQHGSRSVAKSERYVKR